jgi:hypothetical protein
MAAAAPTLESPSEGGTAFFSLQCDGLLWSTLWRSDYGQNSIDPSSRTGWRARTARDNTSCTADEPVRRRGATIGALLLTRRAFSSASTHHQHIKQQDCPLARRVGLEIAPRNNGPMPTPQAVKHTHRLRRLGTLLLVPPHRLYVLRRGHVQMFRIVKKRGDRVPSRFGRQNALLSKLFERETRRDVAVGRPPASTLTPPMSHQAASRDS